MIVTHLKLKKLVELCTQPVQDTVEVRVMCVLCVKGRRGGCEATWSGPHTDAGVYDC